MVNKDDAHRHIMQELTTPEEQIFRDFIKNQKPIELVIKKEMLSIFLAKKFLLLVFSVIVLGWICYDGLELMVSWWDRDEYSHGWMIPGVAIYLLWCKRNVLAEKAELGSYKGLILLGLSLFTWLLGELSSIYTIIQYAFFIGLFALALLWVGV